MTNGTRKTGWWLPDPKAAYNGDRSRERADRMKFFAAWGVYSTVLADLGFCGLMLTEAKISFVGSVCAAVVFGSVLLAVAGVIIALAWCVE